MGWDTHPNVGWEVDCPYPRREVIAWNMDLEGCTLDMGFDVRNIIVNAVTTGK